MRRLPVILSATALAVALLGSTPLGEAALRIVPLAKFARNADRVDGIHASRVPRAGYLVPLGSNGRFPPAVGAVGPQGDPGPPGPAGAPGVSGLVLASMDTSVDSSSPKSAQANCPDGKKILGGGAELTTNTAAAPVVVHDSRPVPTGSGWYASAGETASFASSWALRVWAVCATVS